MHKEYYSVKIRPLHPKWEGWAYGEDSEFILSQGCISSYAHALQIVAFYKERLGDDFEYIILHHEESSKVMAL